MNRTNKEVDRAQGQLRASLSSTIHHHLKTICFSCSTQQVKNNQYYRIAKSLQKYK
jgi:hypothetical protein